MARIYSLKLDDKSRIWISTIVKNMKVHQWWVLDKKGALLVRFRWQREKEIEVIKGGYLYTKEVDSKDVPCIVRYDIEME